MVKFWLNLHKFWLNLHRQKLDEKLQDSTFHIQVVDLKYVRIDDLITEMVNISRPFDQCSSSHGTNLQNTPFILIHGRLVGGSRLLFV
jgi:hypothetical protein